MASSRRMRSCHLLDGDQDVWLASCAGFYASPYGRPGEPCPQPFWGCLDCGNAVITARKLPAILAFLAFIEAEREGLAAADWRAKFGHIHARITNQVLPAFSESGDRGSARHARHGRRRLSTCRRRLGHDARHRIERRHCFPIVMIVPCLPLRRFGPASIAAISPAMMIRAGISGRRCSGRTRAAATSPCISDRSPTRRSPKPCAPISMRASTSTCRAIGHGFRPPACVRRSTARDASSSSSGRSLAPAISHASISASLDRYAKALRSSGLRPIIAAQLLEIVFDLYAYRDHLGRARLRVRALAGPLSLPGRGISFHARREPYAPHPGADHHAAAGLVAALCFDLRAGYFRRARRTREPRSAPRRAACRGRRAFLPAAPSAPARPPRRLLR